VDFSRPDSNIFLTRCYNSPNLADVIMWVAGMPAHLYFPCRKKVNAYDAI
jgi:hypothetical protein